jgi:hypothetical protein
VEGAVAILQLRVFKNDLEEALGRLGGRDSFQMTVSPEVDALFLRYLAQRFRLEVGEDVLEGHIVGSGEDELDREPVWWYQIQYTASEPIQAARITNTILFEIFQDQRNVLRVVRFPGENRRAYYFAPGEETIQVGFSPRMEKKKGPPEPIRPRRPFSFSEGGRLTAQPLATFGPSESGSRLGWTPTPSPGVPYRPRGGPT